MKIQCFRRKGVVICVKVGFIAVDIPFELNVKDVEYRGTSTRGSHSYYDIAMDGRCLLHILRASLNGKMTYPPAYFFEEYPL